MAKGKKIAGRAAVRDLLGDPVTTVKLPAAGTAGASIVIENKSDRPMVVEPHASEALMLAPRRKVHVVKCWPEFFEEIAAGRKRAELRLADRDYQVGDHIIEQEYKPGSAADCGYTGREVRVEITHVARADTDKIMRAAHPLSAIQRGWCLISIELAGAPSVLVRALDELCSAVEALDVLTTMTLAPGDPLKVAAKAGRDALGVVQRS